MFGQCLNLCLLSSILLGILYLFFGAFPLVFGGNHGFKLWQTGLSFLGLFIGMLIGILSNSFIWKRQYDYLVRREEKRRGEPSPSEPEFRLPPTIVGAWLVPIGLFGKSSPMECMFPQNREVLDGLVLRRLMNDDATGFGWTVYPSVSNSDSIS
jgi:hypothetical protein